VKLDLVYEKGEGIEIVDWKTGAGEADRLQFLVYAIFACEEYEVLPEQITVTEYSLLGDGPREHRFSAGDLNDGVDYIRNSITEMKSMLGDPDNNTASMKDFPRTSNERLCETCSFRKICFELD
jgi:hypothetical protein